MIGVPKLEGLFCISDHVAAFVETTPVEALIVKPAPILIPPSTVELACGILADISLFVILIFVPGVKVSCLLAISSSKSSILSVNV